MNDLVGQVALFKTPHFPEVQGLVQAVHVPELQYWSELHEQLMVWPQEVTFPQALAGQEGTQVEPPYAYGFLGTEEPEGTRLPAG